jgi:hypothetical protein
MTPDTGEGSAPVMPCWINLIRAAYGIALICDPSRLIRLPTGARPSRRARAIGRVLGARHLAQAVICAAVPAQWLVSAGAAADLAHAASMTALSSRDTELRPALLADSAIATAFAAVGTATRSASPRGSVSSGSAWVVS